MQIRECNQPRQRLGVALSRRPFKLRGLAIESMGQCFIVSFRQLRTSSTTRPPSRPRRKSNAKRGRDIAYLKDLSRARFPEQRIRRTIVLSFVRNGAKS